MPKPDFKPIQNVPQKHIDRFWSRVRIGTAEECWLYQRALFLRPNGKPGYGAFSLPGGRNIPASRAAFAFFYSDPGPHACVLHRCDNPPCCNPDHLFLGSPRDNAEDMRAKGRKFTKLNETQVREIRAHFDNGVPKKRIGRMYGIYASTVTAIVKREKWAHVS